MRQLTDYCSSTQLKWTLGHNTFIELKSLITTYLFDAEPDHLIDW